MFASKNSACAAVGTGGFCACADSRIPRRRGRAGRTPTRSTSGGSSENLMTDGPVTGYYAAASPGAPCAYRTCVHPDCLRCLLGGSHVCTLDPARTATTTAVATAAAQASRGHDTRGPHPDHETEARRRSTTSRARRTGWRSTRKSGCRTRRRTACRGSIRRATVATTFAVGKEPCSGSRPDSAACGSPTAATRRSRGSISKDGKPQATFPLTIADDEGGVTIGAGSFWILTDTKGHAGAGRSRDQQGRSRRSTSRPARSPARSATTPVWVTSSEKNIADPRQRADPRHRGDDPGRARSRASSPSARAPCGR